MEAFLGMVQHLGKKETGKVEYSYIEIRRMQGQFSWRIPELSDDKPLQEAATVAASKKGIRFVEKSSFVFSGGSATKLTGELNSTSLKALFSDPTFRKSLKGDFHNLKPISDADKEVLIAAGVDLKSAAAAQPTVAASAPADLVAQLQKKISSEGPFDQALFDRTAAALRASDPQSPAMQELQANARDFVDGKVRASMFVAYLKETLPSITAANAGARESLKLLQEQSAGGDLWAKFFLARAHFHAAANAKEAQLRERFIGKGFPNTVRPYWDAYQTALRDPSFDGKFETAVTLAEEGAKKNFAPSVNVLGVMRLNGLGLPKDESHGLQLIRQAADAGFSMAMLGLANAYANGQGTPKDLTQAHSWWRKASDLGQADAMYALAFSFADGHGVPKNQAEAVGWLRKAAELGHPASMSSLGDFYAAGHGVAKDELVATQWYRKAAEAGETYAMVNLGWRYDNGRGVAKDEAQAVQWYRKAAEARDADAMVNLGVAYAKGRGVTKDEAQAVQWNRKAAELGHAGAMVNLGNLYAAGVGVAKDEAQATQWYRKAAESGNVEAMVRLGDQYAAGQGVPKDEAQAAQWYRKGAEGGNATAMFNLGSMYSSGSGITKDPAQSTQWYRKAAEAGHVDAMFNLGVAYHQGLGVAKDDMQAVQWYQKAAEVGDVDAMLKLGVAYSQGRGIGKDPAQSVQWYRKASELGNARAMYMLGLDYLIGDGVPKDDAQAFQWVRKAAQLGDDLAMDYLGKMYEEGLWVAKDNAQALEWYQKAAAAGNEKAAQSVQRLRDGTAQGSSSMSAKEWDFKYRNAKPISPAELLNRLPPVKLEFMTNNEPLQYVSFPELEKIAYEAVVREGLTVSQSSAITLRIEFNLQATIVTHTGGNEYGTTINDKHPAHLTFTKVQIVMPVPVYRDGEFYHRAVMPVSSYESFFGYFYDLGKPNTILYFQDALKKVFLGIKAEKKPYRQRDGWATSLWGTEQAQAMHGKYLRAQSEPHQSLGRSFSGITTTYINTALAGEAGTFTSAEMIESGWKSRLSAARLAHLPRSKFGLRNELMVGKQDINKYKIMPVIGMFAPAINYSMIQSRTSLWEEDAVFEFNGTFVRTDIYVYDDIQISGSLWKDTRQEVLGLLDRSMKDFVREAQSNR